MPPIAGPVVFNARWPLTTNAGWRWFAAVCRGFSVVIAAWRLLLTVIRWLTPARCNGVWRRDTACDLPTRHFDVRFLTGLRPCTRLWRTVFSSYILLIHSFCSFCPVLSGLELHSRGMGVISVMASIQWPSIYQMTFNDHVNGLAMAINVSGCVSGFIQIHSSVNC